ncbi:hypothetical protein [Capsulimonas corticalis]|uniref:hypothetical protein n=1 Tax=Capsulimonas corticalis TaxID=2219043 RepID=UPI000F6476A5|nr:hypothetical protein [Capsulimonas corticalis]
MLDSRHEPFYYGAVGARGASTCGGMGGVGGTGSRGASGTHGAPGAGGTMGGAVGAVAAGAGRWTDAGGEGIVGCAGGTNGPPRLAGFGAAGAVVLVLAAIFADAPAAISARTAS